MQPSWRWLAVNNKFDAVAPQKSPQLRGVPRSPDTNEVVARGGTIGCVAEEDRVDLVDSHMPVQLRLPRNADVGLMTSTERAAAKDVNIDKRGHWRMKPQSV